MSSSTDDKKIKIWHRLNKLKLKAGAELGDSRRGYIDPLKVKRAQAAIDDNEKSYYEEIQTIIVCLDSTWNDLQHAKDDKKRCYQIRELMNYANNIKDIALTYDYELMGYFGQSLCDFCLKADPENDAHKAIIQAHLDVMNVTFETHIKENVGQQAEELKSLLLRAIKQHS